MCILFLVMFHSVCICCSCRPLSSVAEQRHSNQGPCMQRCVCAGHMSLFISLVWSADRVLVRSLPLLGSLVSMSATMHACPWYSVALLAGLFCMALGTFLRLHILHQASFSTSLQSLQFLRLCYFHGPYSGLSLHWCLAAAATTGYAVSPHN